MRVVQRYEFSITFLISLCCGVVKQATNIDNYLYALLCLLRNIAQSIRRRQMHRTTSAVRH